jgi:hypothetical protein
MLIELLGKVGHLNHRYVPSLDSLQVFTTI